MAPDQDRGPDLDLVDPADLAAQDLVVLAAEVPVHRRPADRVGPGRVRPVVLTGLVVPADPRPAARVVLGLAVPVVLGRVDPHRGDLVVTDRVDPAGLAVPAVHHRPVPVVVTNRVDPAVRGLEARVDPVDLVARTVPVSQAVPARVDLVVDLDNPDLVVPADLVVPTDPAAQVGQVARTVPVDPAVPADLRRRLMCSTVLSIGVVRSSAVRGTRRTASAHPITALRHRPRSTGSAGTTGLLRGIRRRTGTGRLLPVAGTVRRLPVVGTRRTTVRAAT